MRDALQEIGDELLARRCLWQWHVDVFGEAAQRCVVERVGPVRGAEHQHAVRWIVTDPIALQEELVLQARGCFVVAVAALTEQRVDLVDENHRRAGDARQAEQRPHHLFTLAHKLLIECGRRNVVEFGVARRCSCRCQPCKTKTDYNFLKKESGFLKRKQIH